MICDSDFEGGRIPSINCKNIVRSKIHKKEYDNCIIINNAFNTRYLKYAVRSLLNQQNVNILLVIIDYMSPHHEINSLIQQLIRRKKDFIVIAQRGKDLGSTNQRNIADYILRKYFICNYVLFMDSDVIILDRYFLYKLNNILYKVKPLGFTHALYNLDNSLQWTHGKMLGPFLIESANFKKTINTDLLHGAFLGIRHDLVFCRYRFPLIFFIGFDDYNLSLLIKKNTKKAYNLISLNISKVIHIKEGTTSRCNTKRLKEGIKNLIITFVIAGYKHLIVPIIIEYIIYKMFQCLRGGNLDIFRILDSVVVGIALGLKYKVKIC